MYVYETGKRNDSLAAMLDYANITGPGNYYSLHIHVEETMDLRSLLNVETDSRVHLPLFLKYTLNSIPILKFKMELQVSTTQPNPIFCRDEYRDWISDSQSGVNKLFTTYCSSESQTNVTDTIVLETEYLKKQYNMNPLLVISMLKSGILTEKLLANVLHLHLNDYILSGKANSVQIRPILLLMVLEQLRWSNTTLISALNEPELKYIELWYPLRKYLVEPYPSLIHQVISSELKRFKLQNLLMDSDLELLCEALKTATRLETLDLSHNQLYNLVGLIEVFPYFKRLKKLDLSANGISPEGIETLATGFEFLPNLRELYLSGSLTLNETPKKFTSNLMHLKQLRTLDISSTMVSCDKRFADGLSLLTNLRKLNMSSCVLSDRQFKQLATSFIRLSNLEVLDLSNNFIQEVPVKGFVHLKHIREIDLSHNFINALLTELLMIRYLFPSLRKINLSYNILCDDQRGLNVFLGFIPQSVEIDLSYNFLVLDDELRHIKSNNKKIKLDGSVYVTNEDTQRYAKCICEWVPPNQTPVKKQALPPAYMYFLLEIECSPFAAETYRSGVLNTMRDRIQYIISRQSTNSRGMLRSIEKVEERMGSSIIMGKLIQNSVDLELETKKLELSIHLRLHLIKTALLNNFTRLST